MRASSFNTLLGISPHTHSLFMCVSFSVCALQSLLFSECQIQLILCTNFIFIECTLSSTMWQTLATDNSQATLLTASYTHTPHTHTQMPFNSFYSIWFKVYEWKVLINLAQSDDKPWSRHWHFVIIGRP